MLAAVPANPLDGLMLFGLTILGSLVAAFATILLLLKLISWLKLRWWEYQVEDIDWSSQLQQSTVSQPQTVLPLPAADYRFVDSYFYGGVPRAN